MCQHLESLTSKHHTENKLRAKGLLKLNLFLETNPLKTPLHTLNASVTSAWLSFGCALLTSVHIRHPWLYIAPTLQAKENSTFSAGNNAASGHLSTAEVAFFCFNSVLSLSFI